MLFAICSSSVLVARKFNDRYAIYTIFLAIYFVSFGLQDVVTLSPRTSPNIADDGFLSASELLILIGGIVFSFGYQISAQGRNSKEFAAEDWPMTTLVTTGLLLWAAGTYATWYWNMRLTVRAGEFHNNAGGLATALLMFGRYVQPLGILIIAYAYTISRSKTLTLIMVGVACFQVYLGFVSDTKEGAMIAGILVIVTSYLVKGKIPISWAIAGVVFIFCVFPVFQAHRSIVVGDRGLSNAESAQNVGNALKLSIEGQKQVVSDGAQSFFERSSVKSAIEMIVKTTGRGVAYQQGHTLLPLLTALIPRLIWPDKLDVQTGQLLNQEFHVTGDTVTYISPSHLGELYWNFGWSGAVIGMLLLGLLLGWLNRLCDMSTASSVTRLLILAITIYQVCVRFEGSIASEYAVWLRTVLLILVLHWLFARRGMLHESSTTAASSRLQGKRVAPSMSFPNLMK
jgi:hypothetical protein